MRWFQVAEFCAIKFLVMAHIVGRLSGISFGVGLNWCTQPVKMRLKVRRLLRSWPPVSELSERCDGGLVESDFGKPLFAARCLFVDKNNLASCQRGLCLGTRKA